MSPCGKLSAKHKGSDGLRIQRNAILVCSCLYLRCCRATLHMRHTAARARAAGSSGSTRVHSSPFPPTRVRDSPADKRARPKGSKDAGKRARTSTEVTHSKNDAGLAPSRKSLVAKADGRGDAPRSPLYHPARASLSAGHPPKGPSSLSDARAASSSSGSKSRDDRTGYSREGAASSSSESGTASHTSDSKARRDRTAHSREGLASSSSGTRAASNNSGSKSLDERTENPLGRSASISSDAHTASNTSVSKARDDHTGHSREGSASNSPGARNPSNSSGSDSKEQADRTGNPRAGSVSESSDVRNASNTNGSKLLDDGTEQSPSKSSSTPSDARTASKSSGSKSREDRTRHPLGASAPSPSNSRTASNFGVKSRGDHDVSAEKGRRPVVPPPHSRAEIDPAKSARGGRATHSGQSAKSATGQATETVSSDASIEVSSSSIVGFRCLRGVFQLQ